MTAEEALVRKWEREAVEKLVAERDRYARALRTLTIKHLQFCAWDAGHSVGDKLDSHVSWLIDREARGPWRESWKGWWKV